MKPKVAMIRDGWVSPADIVSEYGSYGLAAGLVDENGAAAIDAAADSMAAAIDDGQWADSHASFEQVLATANNESDGVNVYYILDPVPFYFFGGPGVDNSNDD